jgi:hypothetical protein
MCAIRREKIVANMKYALQVRENYMKTDDKIINEKMEEILQSS